MLFIIYILNNFQTYQQVQIFNIENTVRNMCQFYYPLYNLNYNIGTKFKNIKKFPSDFLINYYRLSGKIGHRVTYILLSNI